MAVSSLNRQMSKSLTLPSTSSGAKNRAYYWPRIKPRLGTTPLQHRIAPSKANTNSWVRHLDANFQERRIAVLDNKYLQITDDIALPWTLMHLMATVEFIQHIDQPPGVAEDWWKLYHCVCNEVRDGASMRMAMVSIVGQKPPKG